MKSTIKNIRSVNTNQVVRLSNGWLVTSYRITNNSHQFIKSTDNGLTWSNLCTLLRTQSGSGDLVNLTTLTASGTNVVCTYHNNPSSGNVHASYIVQFDATSVTEATNINSSATLIESMPRATISKVQLLNGRFQFLRQTSSSDESTISKSHYSSTTIPPSGQTNYTFHSGVITSNDSQVYVRSDGQEWIFFGNSNALNLYRRLTANATPQAFQTIVTVDTGYFINRINIVEYNGKVYIFYSYRNTAGSCKLAYTTTSDGVSFTSAVVLLSDPYTTSNTQGIDFDVIATANKACLLLAIPNGANRLLYAGNFNGSLKLQQVSNTTTANSYPLAINSVALIGKLYYFSAQLADGGSYVEVQLDVDGIKQLVSGSWASLEQAYRHNGTTQQEQNGKIMTSSTWNDIS